MKRLMTLMVAGVLILMSSCTSSKKLVYLQESRREVIKNQRVIHPYEIKIQDDDLLYITISSKDAELVEPFKNSTLLGAGVQTHAAAATGFLVDTNGYISIPSLGKVEVRGLTCSEIATKIEQMMIMGNYIKDPVVSVRLGNFKVTVLGEVSAPGTIAVEGNRLSILDAISRCGDLKPTGKRKNVKILREQNGVRNVYKVDLTQADLINSPYYYLCQNDVVYVEPNKSISVSSSPWTTYLSVGGTLISLILSAITLTTVSK